MKNKKKISNKVLKASHHRLERFSTKSIESSFVPAKEKITDCSLQFKLFVNV